MITLGWRDRLTVVWRASRPPFLLLTPVMVLLAYAMAIVHHQDVLSANLGWVLLAAFMAAIASNLLNEYFDFKSGLDQQTIPTPFSGGSQALVEQPSQAEIVKWAGLFAVSITVWTGLYLVAQVGWPLLLLGLLGVALLISYTPILNHMPWLCLLAPGLGYGLVMYLGSYWAIVGQVDWYGVWLLPVPVLLVSALLLMNQFPDVEADQRVGRYHAVIAWGRPTAYVVLVALHVWVYVYLIALVILAVLPMALLWGLLFLPVSAISLWLGRSMMQSGRVVLSAMGLQVAVVLLLPSLLAMVLLHPVI